MSTVRERLWQFLIASVKVAAGFVAGYAVILGILGLALLLPDIVAVAAAVVLVIGLLAATIVAWVRVRALAPLATGVSCGALVALAGFAAIVLWYPFFNERTANSSGREANVAEEREITDVLAQSMNAISTGDRDLWSSTHCVAAADLRLPDPAPWLVPARLQLVEGIRINDEGSRAGAAIRYQTDDRPGVNQTDTVYLSHEGGRWLVC